MIEINIHIPIDGVNNISIPIQLPVVPRVGEKIYLSNKQVDNLISLFISVPLKWDELNN